MVRGYTANTDRLFFGPWAHNHITPVTDRLERRAGGVPNLRTGENVPDWFELD
jgi:hypothetical protein